MSEDLRDGAFSIRRFFTAVMKQVLDVSCFFFSYILFKSDLILALLLNRQMQFF